jgi:hypothetical protein
MVPSWEAVSCPYIAEVKTANAIARNYRFQNGTPVVPDFNLGGDAIAVSPSPKSSFEIFPATSL